MYAIFLTHNDDIANDSYMFCSSVFVGAAGGELYPGYGAGPGGGGRRLLRSGNCSSDTLEDFLKDSPKRMDRIEGT